MFQALADEFWQDYLRLHPVAATLMGYRGHDDRMPDVTPEGRAALHERLIRYRERLGGAEAGDLPEADRVSRSALAAEIDAQVAELECDLDAWTLDPLSGPQVMLLQLPSLQKVNAPAQGRDLVARYRAFGPYLDAVTVNLRRALTGEKIAAASPAGRVSQQLEALLSRPLDEWELLAPMREPHDDWEPAERNRFRSGLEEAVRDVVRPAFQRFAEVIRREVLPRARSGERVGLRHLPDGEEAYRRLIRVHTSLPLGPGEVHAFGQDEIVRIRAALCELGEQVVGSADLGEIVGKLRGDPALHFRGRDEIEEKARSALLRASEALPRILGRSPATPCEVRRIEPFEEEHSTIAYYRQPAADGTRPGTYWVNTHAPETRPRYEAEALAYHESVPGHHVQVALAQEAEELPEFRRHLGATAFVEGWALYAESLAEEQGLYSGDLDRIGMLSFDAWRASRLVVDTGIHALGWSRRRAIEFMLANTALTENNIINEVDRYIVWPGQALAYKTGQREILALRREARRRLGSAFDIRAFHDRLLADGAVGLPLLRERIEAWLGQDGRPGCTQAEGTKR